MSRADVMVIRTAIRARLLAGRIRRLKEELACLLKWGFDSIFPALVEKMADLISNMQEKLDKMKEELRRAGLDEKEIEELLEMD